MSVTINSRQTHLKEVKAVCLFNKHLTTCLEPLNNYVHINQSCCNE